MAAEEQTHGTKRTREAEEGVQEEVLDSRRKSPKLETGNEVDDKESKSEDTDKTDGSDSEKKEEEGEKNKDTEASVSASGPETKEAKQDDIKSADTTETKPVFGSGFAFGGAFGKSTPKQDIFGGSEKSEAAATKTTTTTDKPVFGSGTTFGGGGFGTAPTKNVFDEKKPEETKKEQEEEKDEEEDDTTAQDQYVQLKTPLEAKQVETGEELEESVFTCDCALYALSLDEDAKGWKERGRGTLHINTTTKDDVKRSRLVMRSKGVYKVILNIPLTKGNEVFKGMKSSLNSEKFVRVCAFENNAPAQFAIRVGSVESATKLYDHINELIPN